MTDNIINTLEEMVQRWMNSQVKGRFLDKDYAKSPDFVSMAHKVVNQLEYNFLDGKLTMIPGLDSEEGLLLDAFIGEKNRYGRGTAGVTDVSLHTTTIKRIIDRNMNALIRAAFANYNDKVSLAQFRKEKGLFFALSQEPAAVSLPEARSLGERMLSSKQIHELERLSELVYRNEHVWKSLLTVSITNNIRRYVNSEKTKIRSCDFRAGILLSALVENNRSERISYFEPIFNTNLPSQLRNFSIKKSGIKKILGNINSFANARSVETGKYPVIMDGSALGVFFHEAIAAHLLSGEYIYRKETNVFSDKIGKEIMPSFLTLIDDPSYKKGFGHYAYDEEGIRGQKTVLVENGILKNFLLDRKSAGQFGLHSNGHARSEWVMRADEKGEFSTSIPEPRISNLFVLPSSTVSEDELIKHMLRYCEERGREFGLYFRWGEGCVSVENGEFILSPQSVFKMYTDGRKELVSGVTLSGSPFYLLDQIVLCSNKYSSTYGFCGSNSGTIPTWQRAPSAFLKEAVVNKVTRLEETERILPKII